MVLKTISLIVAAILVSQVSSRNVEEREARNIIQIRLDDVTVNHITNPLIGTSISIPHLILDTLEECAVTFPNGINYQVFPNGNLPSTVIGHSSVFPACGIMFRGVSVSMSGTYELMALTTHRDNRRTIQQQRFIVNFRESAGDW